MTYYTTSYDTYKARLTAEYLSPDLKELAALICQEVPSRKDERVDAIVQTMFHDLQGIFAKLSLNGQHAVSETVHTWDGTYQSRMFINKYKSTPWTETSKGYGRKIELLDLFLIRGGLPSDLLEKLRKFVPKPPKDTIRYTENEDVLYEELTVRETSRAALANLATLLTLTEKKEIRVSAKTSKATAATVKKISNSLYEQDWYADQNIEPMQPFSWPLLLQGGGLAKMNGSFLKLSPAGRKALKNDLPGGLQTVWRKWEKTKIIDEFSRVTAIKGQRSNRGRAMTTPVKRRPAINKLLKDLQPGKWISIDEFARLIQSKAEYSFAMTNYDWKLYIVDQHYGNLDYCDTWLLVNLRYILVYLFEYCATLGLIDVAYQSPYEARQEDYRDCWGADELDYLCHCDGLKYIRINTLGAFVMGHDDEYSAENSDDDDLLSFEATELIIQDPANIPPGQEMFFEKIAERTEVDRWRLSVSSLITAIRGGDKLSEIKKMLTSSSTKEFSQEMQKLFMEVEHRSTAFIDAGKTILIECSSEARKQALTNKKFKDLCLPVGEKYLIGAPGKEQKFLKALEAAGFILGSK